MRPLFVVLLSPRADRGTGWYSSTFAYNELGGAISQTNPMGFTLTQQWNAAAMMTALTSSWSDATHPAALGTVNTYNAGGAITQMTLGNGLVETRAFNPRGQVLEMRTYDPGTSTDKIRLTYGYVDGSGKNNGNVMSWNAAGAQVFMRSYTYDDLNRIKTMAAPTEGCAGLTWVYDIWANRKDQTTTAGACGESHLGFGTNNRINSANYQYDLAGNLTAEPGGRTYEYDAENRLKTVNNGAIATYTYDANGSRIRKVTGGVTTDYIYAGGSVVAEREGSTWIRGYVQFGGQMLAQYNGVIGSGGATTYFAHKDHLGSTRLLTKPDKSYSPSDVYDFLPFGESNSCTGSGTSKNCFTDKQRDAESSLDYFGARYFSSRSGRFLTTDWSDKPETIPYADFSDPQTFNLYQFVVNSPIVRADKDGHQEKPGVVDRLKEYFSLLLKPFTEALESKGTVRDEQSEAAVPHVPEGHDLAKQHADGVAQGTEVTVSVLRMADVLGLGSVGESAMKGDYAGAAMTLVVGVLLNRTQIHHIASNKGNNAFTSAYKAIFDKARMSLDDLANKIALPGHVGRHTDKYKQYVLDSLTQAVAGLKDPKKVKAALKAELDRLRKELEKNPNLIHMQ